MNAVTPNEQDALNEAATLAIDTEIKKLREDLRLLQTQRSDAVDVEFDLDLADAPRADRLAAKAVLRAVEEKIKSTEEAIKVAQTERRKFNKEVKAESDANVREGDKNAIEKAVNDNHIGYITAGRKFTWCKNTSSDPDRICNPQFTDSSEFEIIRTLNKMTGRQISLSKDEVIDHLEKLGRAYFNTTASMNTIKYNGNDYYNRATVIRNFWVTPEKALPHHEGPQEEEWEQKLFDFLIYCVGGGKQENVDHLEQWVLHKLRYPEKSASTPNLDIGGRPGGNGKGLFVSLCRTIFTSPCVVSAAVKEAGDNFNANLEMAVIVNYDEPKEGELSDSVLKKSTGSEEMRLEKKGVDAVTVDRLANMIYTSNNEKGVAKLAGTGRGGEDRRWSVITTNISMTTEALRRFGCSEDEALTVVNHIAVDLIKDSRAVARWLKRIEEKHNTRLPEQKLELKALHGSDYRERVLDQKSRDELMWDAIVERAITDGGITDTLLNEVMGVMLGKPKCRVGKDFMAKVKDKGHQIVKEDQTNVDMVYGSDVEHAKRKVFYRINGGCEGGIDTVDLAKYWANKPSSALVGRILTPNHLTVELRELVPPSVMGTVI